ncbi:hypothetical protein FH609_016895 [Streptomyces sp. 3MP-14]|uniref:DUF4386 family protein n=1 Tax=Streptomyces mimosae TaxID=2586635 RepID=A0A5N6A8W5_9ACTN|nr:MULTISPECIES: hypothetical protein [Streptomyces]KAB8165254.1 hypothetical protein FH607_014220 [Streptomyces mimosae]KAB8175886.1 hypothetical protein FH609_016895 [Streptomyces sp. 3MP-14]
MTVTTVTTASTAAPHPVFPGRWVGGASLVIGPPLLLTGMVLRLRFDFFFPAQLSAYERHPDLMAASYALVSAGWVLLWPGVVLLAARIGERFRELALWGGVLTVLGLFARAFHAGVDHLAFQLVAARGAAAATRTVGDTYGAFHLFSTLNAAVMGGWLLLAVGAYRSGVLRLPGAAALALASAMPLGVLKGTTPLSIAAAAGLCVALVPLGVAALRDGRTPRATTVAGRLLLLAAVGVAMFLLGRAG